MGATEDRDLEIWRRYVRGERQADLARAYSVDQSAISRAIARHRDTIPKGTREEIIAREIDFLESTRNEILSLWVETSGAPVTAGKDGDIVRDPETNEVVRDHTGRLNAARMALAYTESRAKHTGIDAAVRVDLGASEEAAAIAAAAEAQAHLHGGTRRAE
jgi:hypothetical protein